MINRNCSKRCGFKLQKLVAIITIAATLLLWGANVSAVQDAVLRASGNLPAEKTAATLKAEKELEKLTAKEKQIKEQITEATINRSKLLAQKRAVLKEVRKKRDDAINKEISGIKVNKERQAALIKELKNQLAAAKKTKSTVLITALELSVKLAEVKLKEINDNLKKANDKLSKSYTDYKTVYDNLTRLDADMKKVLDLNSDTEKKIKNQKEDLKNTKN